MNNPQQIFYRDRPIKLVDIKEDGIFEITSEGISFLSSLKNQTIAVLSVTGPYRSGKSFLANLIMNNMGGFKVGATINACTKGLWVWGRPIPLSKNKKLIILDSEGLGSVEKDRTGNIDMKIFTLSVLLSSCLIYNTKHAISEDKIEELSNVANLSKRINISKDKKKNMQLDFGDFFPDLIWVLRDFSLDRGKLSPKEYLEQCLQRVDVRSIEGGETKNICRDIITRNFKHRDCYTLVVPTTDEAKLRNLDNEPQSSLRKEFLDQVQRMILSIKDNIKPKKINNIELDGEALFGLLQIYVESINNEENPVILSALENVLLAKAKNISENAYDIFKEQINNKLKDRYPLNENQIYNIFFEQQNTLVDNFCKNVKDSLSAEQISSYILKLFGRMTDELDFILENNASIYEDYINSEKENIAQNIILKEFTKIEDSNAYLMNLSNQILAALNKFTELESTSDFSKKMIFAINQLLQEKLFDNLRRFGRNVENLYSNNIMTFQSTIDDLNIKIKSLKNTIAQEKKITEIKEKDNSDTKIKIYELESKLETLKRKNRDKEKEFNNNLDSEIQKYQKMENSYMNLIQEKDDKIHILEMQVSQLGNKNSQNRNELSKENAKLMYEIKKLKEQRYTMNNKISLDNASYQSNQELQNMYNIFQDNVKQFRDSVNKLSQDKENLFKTQFIEKLKEDAESKTRNWGKEISDMIEKEFERIQSDYEITIDKLKKENDRLEKENIFLKENNKNTVNVQPSNNTQILKQNLKEVMAISKSKETIIKTQADTLKIKEEEIEKLKKIKSDLEVKLGETKSNYNIKEVELEDVYSMIEAILTKKKDKYEAHYGVVSKETQQRFNQLKKKYKFKLS